MHSKTRMGIGGWFVFALALGACGDDVVADSGVDSGDSGVEAGADTSFDLGLDGGEDVGFDAGEDAAEDAFVDADASDDAVDDAFDGGTIALEGFGLISGPCARLMAELTSEEPSFFVTHLDFMMDGFDDPEERPLLTEGAVEILEEGTAGGSSGVSEAFAFEVLARCEDASLLASETEIEYSPAESQKTDMVISIADMTVGVSVARAFVFPPDTPYPRSEADRVIGDKLDDILVSTANVTSHEWDKQILLVVAYGEMHAEVVREAWDAFEGPRRADTIVYVVVTDGDDNALY